MTDFAKPLASKPRIGLIGLGLMGHGIGRNLLKNGFDVSVLGNVNRTPVESLIALGAKDGVCIAAMAAQVDVWLVCVPGSDQVDSLVFGEQGIVALGRRGQLFIDCSTSDPGRSVEVAEALAQKGIAFVDAPLGRTPREAELGKLNTLVGATPELLMRVRPILEAFSENVIHIGPVLSAQKTKLINNFVVIGAAALMTEAMQVCRHVGASEERLMDLMAKGPLASPLLSMVGLELLNGHRDGMKFSIDNAAKDLHYFSDMTRLHRQAPSLGPALVALLDAARAQGLGSDYLPALVDTQ